VNGGLIDFQDNLHRGAAEYVTPSMLLQQSCAPAPYTAQPPVVAQMPLQVATGMQGQLLCGPTKYDFLQVHGVTYKPVEDTSVRYSAEPVKAEAHEPEPTARVLTRKELDDRVKAQVQAYVRQHLDDDPRSTRATHEPLTSAEDLAAQRVYSVNAGMAASKGGKSKPIQSRW
jgi:hypothetical protein